MTRSVFAILITGVAGLCVAPAARADEGSVEVSAGAGGMTLRITPPSPAAPPAAVAPSLSAPADPFIPDVYPSQDEAARALGERWARRVSAQWHERPGVVHVACPCPDLFAHVQAGIRAGCDVEDVRHQPADHAPRDAGSGEAWCVVTLVPAPQGGADSVEHEDDAPPAAGTITISSRGPGSATESVRFVEKPWVANFAEFVSRKPGRWIVGHGDRPATSVGDAGREARLSVADELCDLVISRMPGDHGRAMRQRHDVREAVSRALLAGDLVVDRFPQKFDRPYGKLWRETVLVDASDEHLEPLARAAWGEVQARHDSKVKSVLSAAAVLLVTYALYRFANAFTRGYFTWSLRTAAAAAAAGAVVLILVVA